MWGWPVLAALAWAAAAHAELPRIENSPMDAEPSDEQLIEFWPQGAAGEAWAFMECRALRPELDELLVRGLRIHGRILDARQLSVGGRRPR